MTGEFLTQILILLAGSLLVLSVVRRIKLPPILGYLVVGMLLGPHALGLVADDESVRLLAEIAIHEDRRLEARGYLERVLRARPGDQRARAALARLRPAEAGSIPAAWDRETPGVSDEEENLLPDDEAEPGDAKR